MINVYKMKKYSKGVLTFGVGINDCDTNIYDVNGKMIPPFRAWHGMLGRCYGKGYLSRHPSYEQCEVCGEWMKYSVFEEWWNQHRIEGWHLDKDILVKGNKVYAPDTCCFVPQEINKLFCKAGTLRGVYPIGVRFHKEKFEAQLSIAGKTKYLGCFTNIEEAFQSYKKAKESWIKELADKYKDQLETRVYEALYNYKVEITD